MKNLKVVNSAGEKEVFKPRKIKEAIITETHVDDEVAEKIKTRIMRKLNSLKNEKGLIEISTTAIRAEVSSQLLKEGEFRAEEQNRKLGLSYKEFEDELSIHNRDNANVSKNPEAVAKRAYDAIAKEYALLQMPKECSDAYKQGYQHISDLEYYNTRSNCFIWDARRIIREGLQIQSGSYANPPKHLDTLLALMGQNFMQHSQLFSGGTAYPFFNIIIAPFCKGKPYHEIKQSIQSFIFNCNQSLVSRGSQLVFSSLNVEFGVPEFMKDMDAWGPAGVINGTYGDYENEAKIALKALIEVLMDGDGHGKPHLFPNIIFNLRDEFKDSDLMADAFRLVEKFPTPYFANMERDNVNKLATTMSCRTCAVDANNDWENEVLDFGNFSYNTISLPLIAYENKGDKDSFYEKLEEQLNIAYKSIKHRREQVEKALYEYRLLDPLLVTDKYTGKKVYDLDRLSYSFGIVGLNEMCLNFLGEDITTVDGGNFAEEVLVYINKFAEKCKKETGWKFNVLSSPAESLSGRLARIAKERYPDIITQGKGDSVYFTNSHHINVSNPADLIEHLDNADRFHKLTPAGAIAHIFIDGHPKGESYQTLSEKMMDTNISFWKFSPQFFNCKDCHTTAIGESEECPLCNSKNITVYATVTGYTRPIDSFGDNKAQEYADRFRHKL